MWWHLIHVFFFDGLRQHYIFLKFSEELTNAIFQSNILCKYIYHFQFNNGQTTPQILLNIKNHLQINIQAPIHTVIIHDSGIWVYLSQ